VTCEVEEFEKAAEGIEGWLYPLAIHTTRHLLNAQNTLGIEGGCLEIGVYKGRYLSYLATSGRSCLGLDVFVFDNLLEAKSNIEQIVKVSGSASALELKQANTQAMDIVGFADATEALGGIAFASIDGDHSASGIAHDMELVESQLRPGGIIAVDDMFSSVSPAVSEGFFAYMSAQSDLRPVAFADNKLFMTTKGYDELYRIRLMVDMSADPGPLGEKWRNGHHPSIMRPFLGSTMICL